MSNSIHLRPIPSDATHSTLLLSLMIATLLLFAARVSAQTDQGAITGIVQDTSGAMIPNAQISVTNVDTGLVLQSRTNAGGVFVFSPSQDRQLHGHRIRDQAFRRSRTKTFISTSSSI